MDGFPERRAAVAVSAAELGALEKFAIECARAAGAEALRFFRTELVAEDKGGESFYNPVTIADRLAETAIRTRIAARYPTHGVFGEEHGFAVGSAGLTWVIDPIDGTKAFLTGMLHWGVLLALHDGAQPILGVMYQPFTDELFVGHGGHAYYRRGNAAPRPLRARRCERLADVALASTGTDYFQPAALERFQRLRSRVRLTRFGGDCYLYALVAMGQLDLVVEWGLKPYDIQALIPIVQGAGGLATDWQGNDCSGGGAVVVAGDPRVHAAALELLDGASLIVEPSP